MRFPIILILSLLPALAFAQFGSSLGRFEVDYVKGCAPLTININNFLAANCPCDVRFGDGIEGQNTFSHTYTTPGSYILEIDYQSTLPRTDFITIEVVENSAPDFEILTCSSSRATVMITDNNFDQYAIDFDNDGTFENIINQGNPVPPHNYPGTGNYTIGVKGINLIAADNCQTSTQNISALSVLPPPEINAVTIIDTQTIQIDFTPQPDIVNRLEIATNNTTNYQVLSQLDNASNSYTITNSNINAETNYYCFRIGSYDICDNTSTYSATVCTVRLDLAVKDGRNELNWNNGPLINNYSVCTNGVCNLTTLTSNFIDLNATCNLEYCYQITANYASGAVSNSLIPCGIAFSNAIPEKITNLVTEFDEGRINLEWSDPVDFTPEEYRLIKTFKGESESIIGITGSPYLDLIENNSGSYCYSLNYTDICANDSPTLPSICSIYLTSTLKNDNSVQLNWNNYTGYEQGVMEYRIEKYDQAGFLQNTYISSSTSFLDDSDISIFQVARYKVFAVPFEGGLKESYSNEVRAIKKSNLSQPKAFTPNGDGLNDEYRFVGTFIKQFSMKIYNRWGELIFSSSDIETGWDGTYRGELLPTGSFSYSVEITDLANRSYSLSGFFALIRN